MDIKKCDPGLAGGDERQGLEASHDGGRAEQQANRAAQNAVGHHCKTSAASSKLHARVVKAAGQNARQSAGTMQNEAEASSTAQERQACTNAETLHETLDMMQQMIQQNSEGDERHECRAEEKEARRTAEKKEREAHRTEEQKEREARRTAEQKERKAAQVAKLAILGELKQKLVGVFKKHNAKRRKSNSCYAAGVEAFEKGGPSN